MKSQTKKMLTQLLEKYECTIVGERQNRHLVLTIRNKNGVESHLTIAISTSDYRAWKNVERDLKKLTARTE